MPASTIKDSWIRRSTDAWQWTVRQDWQQTLTSAHMPEWFDLDNDANSTLIQRSMFRSTYRIDLPSCSICAKLFVYPTLARRWRTRWRGHDAHRERRIAAAALARGVETVRPVASAHTRGSGVPPMSLLLTEFLPDAHPLNELCPSQSDIAALPRTTRNHWNDCVAQLLASSHRAGFIHRDLHPGNVLIVNPASLRPKACFVDLQAGCFRRRLTSKDIARNIAQLGQWFLTRGSISDRVRFIDTYFKHADHLLSALPERDRPAARKLWIREIDATAGQLAIRLQQQRERQARHDQSRYATMRFAWYAKARVLLQPNFVCPSSQLTHSRFTKQQWENYFDSHRDALKSLLREQQNTNQAQFRVAIRDQADKPVVAEWVICNSDKTTARTSQQCSGLSAAKLWETHHALLARRIPALHPLASVESATSQMSLLLREAPPELAALQNLFDQLADADQYQRYVLIKKLTQALVNLLRQLQKHKLAFTQLSPEMLVVATDAAPTGKMTCIVKDASTISNRAEVGRAELCDQLLSLYQNLDDGRRHLNRAAYMRVLIRLFDRIGNARPDGKKLCREIVARQNAQENC
jgi:hypothetical protein